MARRSTTQRSRTPLPVPDKMSVAMIVNGVETQLKVAPWTTLLDALRDHLDLTEHRAASTAIMLVKIPMGRYGKPEEIANAALFFLASDANTFITGIDLYVGGGMGQV